MEEGGGGWNWGWWWWRRGGVHTHQPPSLVSTAVIPSGQAHVPVVAVIPGAEVPPATLRLVVVDDVEALIAVGHRVQRPLLCLLVEVHALGPGVVLAFPLLVIVVCHVVVFALGLPFPRVVVHQRHHRGGGVGGKHVHVPGLPLLGVKVVSQQRPHRVSVHLALGRHPSRAGLVVEPKILCANPLPSKTFRHTRRYGHEAEPQLETDVRGSIHGHTCVPITAEHPFHSPHSWI